MTKKKTNARTTWDLSLLYKSATDPQIEKDVIAIEKVYEDFAKKFDTAGKEYLNNEDILLEALKDFEQLQIKGDTKPHRYFYLLKDIDADNEIANAKLASYTTRIVTAFNKVRFFTVSLGKIDLSTQEKFLKSEKLAYYRYFLKCIFDDAKYVLTTAEENISALKDMPAHEMWVAQVEKILNMQTLEWKKKKIPVAEAMNLISSLKTSKDRSTLANKVYSVLKSLSSFSEGEINAIFTNKKISDDLRGFKSPEEQTILTYKNDKEVVHNLVKTVTDSFKVAHRFHRVKAKLLKLKKLSYSDRSARVGKVTAKFSFDESLNMVKETFGALDKKYADYIDKYGKGQIDVFPKKGKTSGGYCLSSYCSPTYILLNHVDELRSLSTLAHELGHAFHSELSKKQGPLYCEYSYALAETASTLFESIILDKIIETLPKKDQLILLHDKIQGEVQTIFRQIACFNFEMDLHKAVREKGFVQKEEIARIHNKNMSAYLGPVFKIEDDAGYMFVSWSHIRRFFYVYSYAYGMLVTKALLRRYKQDKSFWVKIEEFLSAGGKDAPENILKSIGLDVSSGDIFKEGIMAIEEDIVRLEKLAKI